MKAISFIVPKTLEGQRLQTIVFRQLSYLPEYSLRNAFKQHDVKIDGVRGTRDAIVSRDAVITVYIADTCVPKAPQIHYDDEHLLVIDKPAGVSCDTDDTGDTPIGTLLTLSYPQRFQMPPIPCHRLDNPTSGLLLLAKSERAAKAMEQAFRKHQIHKQYMCLVRGIPSPTEAVLDAYLYKDEHRARVTIMDRPAANALLIRTEYNVLEAGEVSRLRVFLHTGRTHQIRAHLAYLGHPLLGDDKYGDRAFNREHRAKRLMLSATSLRFSITGEFDYLNGIHIEIPPTF